MGRAAGHRRRRTSRTRAASARGPRSEREHEPLHPAAEADARRPLAPDLLGEPVVAAASRDRRLRASVRDRDELPGRPCVVVEPSHERSRRRRAPTPRAARCARTVLEMGPTRVAQVLEIRGAPLTSAGRARPSSPGCASGCARAVPATRATAGRAAARGTPRARRGRRAGRPDRRSSSCAADALEPERAVPRRLQRDHLGVDGGVVRQQYEL